MCTLYNCCARFFVWIYTTFWNWVWNFITTSWTFCTQQNCSWWCLCCNKWLCWVGLIILAILVLVAVIVLTLLAVLWCVICFIFCLVTGGFFGGNSGSTPTGSSPPNSQGDGLHNGPQPSGPTTAGFTVGHRLRISDLRQLEQLATFRRMLTNMTPVELDIPGMVKGELEIWQASLNRSIVACGCMEGAIGMGLFLGAYAVYALIHPMGPLTALPNVGPAAAAAFAGAAAGKMAGLARAKMRLRQTLRDLREILVRRVPAA